MSKTAPTRYQRAKFITLLGAVVNSLLALIKIVGGFVFHSSGLVADGFHSLSDLFTDAMVLVASKYGSQDADAAHPYGHQRIETAATYVLSILLILTGLAIAWDAFHHLRAQELEHPGLMTVPIAGLSILANEALFWYTRHVGRSISSNLIITNAWHHRSDAASSLIVLVGLIGSFLGYPTLDSVAAIIVGLLIVKMGVDYAVKSVRELIDTGVNPKMLEQIEQIITNTDGVQKVHQLRTRLMGSDIFVDVHVQVNPMISVSEGHYIAQHVHQTLKTDIKHIKDVTVHIDPEDDEITSPSVHLPNRTRLKTTLLDAWCEEFPEINACILHYLDGKLTVDLVGEFPKKAREKLYLKIKNDVKNIPFSELCIRIQNTPEVIFQGS